MNITEKRFRENSGVRFLKNGEIRCHALAKNKVRKWREHFDDYDTPSEDLWPECQCEKAAVPGHYACHFHGGDAVSTVNPPKTILDAMPIDLSEKFKVLMETPHYISRKNDILLIQSRQWELLEELKYEAGTEEAWGMVHEALVYVKKEDAVNARDLLERALRTTSRKEEIWKELYKVEGVLQDLTRVQTNTAKEMRLMATTEQVGALFANILSLIIQGANQYIDDSTKRAGFLQFISREAGRLANANPATIINQLEAGS